MAAMLICIFLGPKFIEYLRLREFGQQIREEGPEEHHEKAGTPDDGRADRSSPRSRSRTSCSRTATRRASRSSAWRSAAPLIGFVDDFLKITRRRSLGLSARYKLLLQAALAVGLWYVARTRSASTRASSCASPTRRSTSRTGSTRS